MEKSTLKEKLSEIDAFIDEQKGYLEVAECAARLEENEDFQKIIVEGFLDKEANRIMGALTTPGSFDKGKLDILQEKLASIRHFKEYFKMLAIQAHLAPEHIANHQKYREDLLKEAEEAPIDADVVGE
jgi:hypothetical protein